VNILPIILNNDLFESVWPLGYKYCSPTTIRELFYCMDKSNEILLLGENNSDVNKDLRNDFRCIFGLDLLY